MRPPSMRSDEQDSALSQWAGWLCGGNEIRSSVHPLLSQAQPKLGNPGLVFAKFSGVLAMYAHQTAVDQWRGRPERTPKLKDQKSAVLDRICNAYNNGWQAAESNLLRHLAERSSAAARSLVADRTGAELIEVAARLTWRMTSRLGESHAFENGFMFHPLFGVPYLPGSGFKGAARFAYWARWIAEIPASGERSRSDAIMRLLFGSRDPAIDEDSDDDDDREHERGAAVFFDVFPPHDARLEVDILNPHFPRWYQGKGLESDDQNPVPNVFLTVSASSPWRFSVALLPRTAHQAAPGDMGEAKKRLRIATDDALQLWGLGAKTAAGYGLFDGAHAAQVAPAKIATYLPARETSRAASASAPAPAPAIADPFLTRLQAFKTSDYSQLRQLIERIEPRADREACLQRLGTRLLEVYGSDKRQLKRLRDGYPALAPYLAKP